MCVCFKVFGERVHTVAGDWITRHGDKLTVIITIIIGGGGGGSSSSSNRSSNSSGSGSSGNNDQIKDGGVY
jgi:uncharacterized spore protein YtfJ